MPSFLRIFIPLFLCCQLTGWTQTKPHFSRDSLELELVTIQADIFRQMKTNFRNDSLQKIELERQITLLKVSDKQKRDELKQQLAALHQRDSIRLAKTKQHIDSLRQFIKGFPVVPFPDDTLFFIFAKVGSFTPKDRAEAITKRISDLAGQEPFHDDSLKIVSTGFTKDIIYGTTILLSVTENDALWLDVPMEALASDYKVKIRNSVLAFQKDTHWDTLLIKSAIAVGILIVLILVITLIIKVFKWTKRKIELQAGLRIKGITIKDYTLLDISSELKVIFFINSLFKWFFILLAVYFSLPVLFGLFPWTKHFATALIGYIINPVKAILAAVWNYMPNLFTIIVIVIVFRYILKGIRYLKNEIEKGDLKLPGFYPDLANPTFQIIRVLIFAFMVVVIFPYLPGSNSPVFQGVSVFLGVLFTFGSSGSLSNLISGLVITYMRSFKVGDRVKIGDVTGDIIERSMLVTRIRTIKNEMISIPNSNILGSPQINYSSEAPERGLILYTTVTIGYDAPWRQVHQLLIDAALATSLIEKEPAPFVLQTSLDDFYVSYQINAYTREPNQQADIYSRLHQNIQDKFNEAGVEIMSPHYKALREGNATTIPPDYLPKDYSAPSFRVSGNLK